MPAADARAHIAVHRALKRGALVRPEVCEECGQPPNGKGVIQAHHPDYSKPLEVEWLCAKCHRRRPTGENGRGGMITFRWSEEFVAQIDKARGSMSRTAYVREAIEEGLAAASMDDTPRPSPAGRKAKTEAAPRPARSVAASRQGASRPSTSPRASVTPPLGKMCRMCVKAGPPTARPCAKCGHQR